MRKKGQKLVVRQKNWLSVRIFGKSKNLWYNRFVPEQERKKEMK